MFLCFYFDPIAYKPDLMGGSLVIYEASRYFRLNSYVLKPSGLARLFKLFDERQYTINDFRDLGICQAYLSLNLMLLSS